MSIKALAWAFQAPVRPATSKLVLLALADCSNATDDTAWPCQKTIKEMTALDDRTIAKAIKDLIAQSYICDTKTRRGTTGQVKVYKILMGPDPVPPTKDPHFCEPKTPKNAVKDPHFCTESPPKMGDVTVKEPSEPRDEPPAGAASEGVNEKVRKERHRAFLKLWCEAFEATYGDRYHPTEWDCKSLRGFLSSVDIDAAELFKVAEAAWKSKANKQLFKCGQSGTIMGFLKWFNDIKGELRDAGVQLDPAGPAKWGDIAQ